MKYKFFTVGLVVIIMIGIGTYLTLNRPARQVACTQEAKLCPDGSAVGRIGPMCEFAQCPEAVQEAVSTTTKINRTIFSNGLSITPLAVIQDNRCPVDVQCIQAGTVKISVQISDDIEGVEKILELGKSQSFGDINITLAKVLPKRNSKTTIASADYNFEFIVATASNSTDLGQGTIQGKVTIGPICPVERIPPDPQCQPTPEMFAARKIFVYEPNKTTLVTTVTPDNKGSFSVILPAGNYYLDITHQLIGGVSGLPTLVQVEKDKAVNLNVNVDTGIR